MNGQPTAQNKRETGADGDLPGCATGRTRAHVAELAELWNVDPATIPHWAPPTHAMQIFRYAEQGSIKLLWISATNPAVSLPDLAADPRASSRKPDLFVVVQDLFLTETADSQTSCCRQRPGARSSARSPTPTARCTSPNAASTRPGEARADLDIFLDYARRMDFRDRDGGPLITWHDPESAFEAWKACSRGRPCDYTGISYDAAAWRVGDPVAVHHGASRRHGAALHRRRLQHRPRLLRDLRSRPRYGAASRPTSTAPSTGRPSVPPRRRSPASARAPDADYPLLLTTGRTVYHFHTRTKTGRAPQLEKAAPDVWVEISLGRRRRPDISEGDIVDITSPRSTMRARARICGIRPGVVFVPFHYGYWDHDADGPDDHAGRAANELTRTSWDPVSKQPSSRSPRSD